MLDATLSLLLMSSSIALAHDFILWPKPGRRNAPGSVDVELWVGHHLTFEEQRGWRHDRVDRLEHISSAETQDLRERGVLEQQPFAQLALNNEGGHLLVLDRPAVDIELEAERFERYLEHERLDGIKAERARRKEAHEPGTERYTRHLKAFVQVGDVLDGTGCQPTGQALELVPVQDPGSFRAGQAALFVLLRDGQPVTRHPVDAMVRVAGELKRQALTTDDAGRVEVDFTHEGQWVLRSVHMVRCSGEACEHIKWLSRWTAFSVHVGAASR